MSSKLGAESAYSVTGFGFRETEMCYPIGGPSHTVQPKNFVVVLPKIHDTASRRLELVGHGVTM